MTVLTFLLLTTVKSNAFPMINGSDINEKLSHSSVWTILQDSRGMMWFGTKDGLNCYNGYDNIIYRKVVSDSLSLGNNFIHSLYEMSGTGELWIGTDDGIYLHDLEGNDFIRFTVSTEEGVTISGPVNDIVDGKDGSIWILAYGTGLFRYWPQQQKLTLYSAPHKISTTHSWSICLDSKGVLWASTFDGGFCRYDAESDSFIFIPISASGETLPDYNSRSFFDDPANNCMWIGTVSYGLVRYDMTSGKMFRYINTAFDKKILGINDIVKVSANELMLGADNGLFVFNLVNQQCERLEVSTYNATEEFRSVFAVVPDQEGGLWIGAYYDGVHYLRPGFDYFRHYDIPESEGRVVSYVEPTADGKGVWLGMTKDGGLCRFNMQKKEFIPYTAKMGHTNVRAICEIGKELWVGFYSDGLLRYNLVTGTKRYYRPVEKDTTTLSHSAVYKIFRTSTGVIYVGTLLGLDQYVPEKDCFMRIPGVRDTRIHDILEDHLGLIWVATYEEGLFQYNPTSQTWTHFIQSSKTGSLPANKLICLYADRQNKLYIGTEGEGLFQYNYETQHFLPVVEEGKLPSNIISAIESDHAGNLWVAAGRALCRIDAQSGEMRIIEEGSNSFGSQYCNNASYSMPDGTMLFGRTGGLLVINPEMLRINTCPPKVYITGTKGAGGLLLPDSKGVIELGPKNTTFSADFVALSYVSPRHNRYACYMEGLEEPWAHSGYERTALYSSLPPGRYVFHVKGANSDGVWNEEGVSIPVFVKTAFGKRPFMLVLYFLILVSGIYLAMDLVNKSQKRKMESNLLLYQMEKDKELFEQKISFFTNIIHEIRTPLSLIKAPLENIINLLPPNDASKENYDIMERNVERLHTLANQLLDFRKIEQNVFVYSFKPADISQVIRNVCYRYKSMCRLKGITLIPNIPDEPYICVADTEALNKIVSNLLSNALKYARDKISVTLERKGKDFVFTVSNNGEKIPEEYREKIFMPFFQINEDNAFRRKEGSGIGLALVKHLVEKHNGRIEVISDPDNTRFIVSIPFVEAALRPESLEKDLLDDIPGEPQREPGYLLPDPEQEFEHTILVVEDNLELLNFLTVNLGRLYNVVNAHNGKEALERLDEKGIIDVILTDILMPVMDGIELCRAVRSEPMYCHIPVVLLTAQTDIRAKKEGLDYGADVFIEKPFSMEFLKAQIASIIKNRNQLKEIFTSSPLTPPQSIARNTADLKFITQVNDIIMANLSESGNLIDSVADSMSISRSSLHKKIKAISGMTPNDYIQLIRLKKAAELLSTGEYQISEISYLVGFNTPSYFSKCFYNQFGLLPREFANKTTDKKNTNEN